MKNKGNLLILAFMAIGLAIPFSATLAIAQQESGVNSAAKPAIVLVHGAFAESSSWDRVIESLLNAGHPAIAAANPLRGVAADCGNCQDKSRQQQPFKNHALHADYYTPRGKRVPLAVGERP